MKLFTIAILLFSGVFVVAANAQTPPANAVPAKPPTQPPGNPSAPSPKSFVAGLDQEVPATVQKACLKEFTLRGCQNKKTMGELHTCLQAYEKAKPGPANYGEACKGAIQKMYTDVAKNIEAEKQAFAAKQKELEKQQKESAKPADKGNLPADRPLPQPTPPAPNKPKK